ncbi:MAG: TonB-dependent receptor [Pseudomonadota bacterium]
MNTHQITRSQQNQTRSCHLLSYGRKSRFWVVTTALVTLAGTINPALSQSAAPGAVIDIDTIYVFTDDGGSAQSQAADRLNAMAGGTAVVGHESYEGMANVTVSDAIGTSPGVVVQDFFGGNDQPRLQIRGSGLQQSPVERGVLVLKDGLPLNRADGSYVIGLMNPGLADFIEIYRGYTANRLGTTVLGGGLNLVSPTAGNDEVARLTLSGGSFGEFSGIAEVGKQIDNFDLLGQFNYQHGDGFRVYNESDRLDANLNVGIGVNDVVKTRFFAGFTDLQFDIPGPLNEEALKDDPKQIYGGPTVTPGPSGLTITNPGPDVQRDRPFRETRQFRLGNRTTATYGNHIFETGLGGTYTEDAFMAPIAASLKETDGGDITGVLKYAYDPDNDSILPLFESTAFLSYGAAQRGFYQNIKGSKAAQIGDNDLQSATLSLHSGLNIPVNERFTINPAVAFTYASRISDDKFGPGLRPVVGFNPVTGAQQNAFALAQDTSYSRHFAGFSPSLGATYEVSPGVVFFAALSRSFEPPTHDDLLATVNGTPFFSPGAPANGVMREAFATPDLDAQTATTLEAGTRGYHSGFDWDATVYYSWIDDELLSLRDSSGNRLAATNADKTRHFGVELGLAKQITDNLKVRLGYTYQDFRFVDDPTHGNNRLAGAPDHVINALVHYDFNQNIYVEGKVTWLPGSTPVDNANTEFADSWVTFDVRGGYKINDTFSLQGEVTNVFDEVYASSVLVTDTAQAGQASFIPGVGRAFRLALTARF